MVQKNKNHPGGYLTLMFKSSFSYLYVCISFSLQFVEVFHCWKIAGLCSSQDIMHPVQYNLHCLGMKQSQNDQVLSTGIS